MSCSNAPKTIFEAKEELAKGSRTALQLVEESIARIEADTSNSFREIHSERAKERASAWDNSGEDRHSLPLGGIPLSVKDNIVTKFGESSAGSKMLGSYSSPFTATAVQRLEEAGAIIVGKTNMDEFGMGSSTESCYFGEVKNPWDHSRVSGGSSGGAAASVASGLCFGAIGSDTGGSVRQPAAFCSVTGLKPTYGRVSRYGLIAYASSLDTIGPLARSAKDCALIFSALAGHDSKDATSLQDEADPASTSAEEALSKATIGIPHRILESGIEPEVRDSFEQAIEKLKAAGVSTVEIEIADFDKAVAAYYITACAEAASNLARYDGVRFGARDTTARGLEEMYTNSRSTGFGKEVRRRILLGNFVLSSGYYDAYYGKAQTARKNLQRQFSTCLRQCNAIALPTSPTTAFPSGAYEGNPLQMYLQDCFTVPASLCGLPAMSLPCGFDQKNLPIGLQLVGRHSEDERLLSLGAGFQELTDFHTQVPSSSSEGETRGI